MNCIKVKPTDKRLKKPVRWAPCKRSELAAKAKQIEDEFSPAECYLISHRSTIDIYWPVVEVRA